MASVVCISRRQNFQVDNTARGIVGGLGVTAIALAVDGALALGDALTRRRTCARTLAEVAIHDVTR
jgi:hypothetical protein